MTQGEVTVVLKLDTRPFDKSLRRVRRRLRFMQWRTANRWLYWFAAGQIIGAITAHLA